MHKNIDGIVILCWDPRKENANVWKHTKRLLIPPEKRFTPIGSLGAPVAVAWPEYFPVKFASAMDDVDFALDNFTEEDFILVGHKCGIYSELLKKMVKRGHAPRQFTLQDMMDDIGKGVKRLKEMFPRASVRGHFLVDNSPRFEEITA